ncbi:ABC transporter permease protein [Vibrio maritimus]|nr:ABC transporter permease protein [Vibrio maritimus]
MSVMAGLTNNYFVGMKSGFTLRWVEQVWSLYSDTIWLTLQIAVATTVINVLVGVPCAYVLAKSKSRWASLFDEILTLPIAIPGMAISLGLILAYGGFSDFRASWMFILVGHVIFTLPFMVKSVLAVLQSINFSVLEEGAAS